MYSVRSGTRIDSVLDNDIDVVHVLCCMYLSFMSTILHPHPHVHPLSTSLTYTYSLFYICPYLTNYYRISSLLQIYSHHHLLSLYPFTPLPPLLALCPLSLSIGKIMFVHALQSMKAGDEITIVYHTDPKNLQLVWGIKE